MGRNKLEIKKLEIASSRQTTYSKRKNGILKKAHELSVLCDVPLVLIMFSPGGKPSTCFGKHSMEEVIAKFSHLPPQERIKRRLEILEALKKTFKRLDHDVNVQEFLGTSTTEKDLTDEAAKLRTRLAQIHEKLGYYRNPDLVNNPEYLMQMQDSLQKSLEQIHRQKEKFEKRKYVSMETTNELPFGVIDEQQLPLLWTPSDNIQHVVLTQESKLTAQREIESFTGSASGSYIGCLGTTSRSDSNNPSQKSAMDNIGQEAYQGNFGGQYPYLSHGLYMQEDSTEQGQSSISYNFGGNYQPIPACQYISNHLPFESPAESAFADHFNYQKQLTIPAPTPSNCQRIARDPSHIVFNNTLNHFA